MPNKQGGNGGVMAAVVVSLMALAAFLVYWFFFRDEDVAPAFKMMEWETFRIRREAMEDRFSKSSITGNKGLKLDDDIIITQVFIASDQEGSTQALWNHTEPDTYHVPSEIPGFDGKDTSKLVIGFDAVMKKETCFGPDYPGMDGLDLFGTDTNGMKIQSGTNTRCNIQYLRDVDMRAVDTLAEAAYIGLRSTEDISFDSADWSETGEDGSRKVRLSYPVFFTLKYDDEGNTTTEATDDRVNIVVKFMGFDDPSEIDDDFTSAPLSLS
jgi:hypothetical protein